MSKNEDIKINANLLNIANQESIRHTHQIEPSPYLNVLTTKNEKALAIAEKHDHFTIDENAHTMMYHILKYENPRMASLAFSKIGLDIVNIYDQNNGVLPILSYYDREISEQIITEPFVTLQDLLMGVMDWYMNKKPDTPQQKTQYMQIIPFILRIRNIQKSHLSNDLDNLLTYVNKSEKLKTLEKHIEQLKRMPIEDALEHIVYSYSVNEYGFTDINWSLFEPIIENCPTTSPYHPSTIPSENGVITLYRGESTKSTSYENALSWTLDVNTAVFFATRFADDADIVKLHQITIDVNSPNILLHLGGSESEVWLNSKNLAVNTQIDTVANIKNHYK